MDGYLKLYSGFLCLLFLLFVTVNAQENQDGQVEQPVQQDTGEAYNPETDLETQVVETGPTNENDVPTDNEQQNTQPQNTQPQNTDTQQQNADTQQQNTDTQPQNTDTEPQNTDTEPQNADTRPQNTDTQPQHADTQPQHADNQPQYADNQPQNMDIEVHNIYSEEANTETDGTDINVDEAVKRGPIVNEPADVREAIDPLEELDMMMQRKLANIKNVSQLCELLDTDCEVLAKEPGKDEDGEKVLVAGNDASKVALFDACNPRNQTVALPKDPNPSIAIWPRCTRALRCGGCCTSDVFSCEPTRTKERFVRVFRMRQPYKGAQRFKFIDSKTVKIIEHLHCDAQCKVKKIHCNPLQEYQSRYCRCQCTNQDSRKTCTDGQIWDDNECACVCPQRKTSFCPHPSRFSNHLCRCTLKQEVAGEIDLAQLLANLGKNIVAEPNNAITVAPNTPTTKPTTPTTAKPKPTTTTLATTTPDRCAQKRCMKNWKGKWDKSRQKCRCVPNVVRGK